MAEARASFEKMKSTRVKPDQRSVLYRYYFSQERLVLGVSAVILFLVAWELVGLSGYINPIFLSSPSRILKEGYILLAQGPLIDDLRISGEEFLLGYSLSIAVGIPVGILVGWYKRLNYVVEPFLSALYATPRIALLPLVILWFGIGLQSKTVIIFLGAVFPIVISSLTGVRTVDVRLINVARCFGATEWALFKSVILPSCVPFILTGLRLGLAHALTGVVVAEFFAARGGVGFMITTAGAMFETDTVFVGILIVAFCGVLFTEVIKRVERRFEKWRPTVGAA